MLVCVCVFMCVCVCVFAGVCVCVFLCATVRRYARTHVGAHEVALLSDCWEGRLRAQTASCRARVASVRPTSALCVPIVHAHVRLGFLFPRISSHV